jgi:hypothetical protein
MDVLKLKHGLSVARTDWDTICENMPYAFFKNKFQYYFCSLNIEILGFKAGDAY